MSQTETHVGKLKQIQLNQEIEEWCKEKCLEIGILELSSYHDNWEEEFKYSDQFQDKYFFVDGEVWEAIEHFGVNEDDIDFITQNSDGTLNFVQQFYNGGTCLSEVLEEGIRRIKQKQNLEI